MGDIALPKIVRLKTEAGDIYYSVIRIEPVAGK